MTYATVTVIVDGALEQEEDFTDYLLMDDFIEGVRQDAQADGVPTGVYIIEHGHEPFDDGECACAQYLTDHHPAFSWNMESES